MTAPTALVIWVPAKLVNPLNERAHWATRAKRARVQRDAVALKVWEALRDPAGSLHVERVTKNRITVSTHWRINAKPTTPKAIAFTAHVARKMDGDGLQAALKSIRDGLQDCGLIHHDGPESGHLFEYHQVVQKPTGVEITVRVR